MESPLRAGRAAGTGDTAGGEASAVVPSLHSRGERRAAGCLTLWLGERGAQWERSRKLLCAVKKDAWRREQGAGVTGLGGIGVQVGGQEGSHQEAVVPGHRRGRESKRVAVPEAESPAAESSP